MISSIALSTFITLGGWSVHSDKNYSYCDDNDNCRKQSYNYNHSSIIVEYDGYTIGTYKNSYFERTNLIGYTYRKNQWSVTGAIGSGYSNLKKNDNTCSLPAFGECVLITVSYSLEPFKLTLMGHALAVAFEFKL